MIVNDMGGLDAKNVNRWALDGTGRIGRITAIRKMEWGECYVGKGLDGFPWASRKPQFLLDADAKALERLLTPEQPYPYMKR